MGRAFSKVILGLVSLAAAVGASYAQTPAHFRGSACVISVSAGCASQGVNLGNCLGARFTPPNFGSSGNSTRLSLFTDYYTQNLTGAGSLVGTVFRNVTISQIGNGASSYAATMRVASQVPASPAAAPALTVLADVNGLQTGCNVRFRVQGQRIPVTGPLP